MQKNPQLATVKKIRSVYMRVFLYIVCKYQYSSVCGCDSGCSVGAPSHVDLPEAHHPTLGFHIASVYWPVMVRMSVTAYHTIDVRFLVQSQKNKAPN